MPRMRPCRILIAAVFLFATAHAQTGAKFEPYGLQGLRVTSLSLYQNSLYAGTDSNGIFRRIVSEPDSGWVYLGLRGKRVLSVYPHQVGPFGFGITAGIRQVPAAGDTTLTYCTNMSETNWFASDTGMFRDATYAVTALDGFPTLAVCGETFAAGSGQIYRKTDVVWEKVFDIDGGTTVAVRAPVYRQDSLRGIVWAGGRTLSGTAFITKSLDKGMTWVIMYPDRSGSNFCRALAPHPENPDVLYAGLDGIVMMTSDQGMTWMPAALSDPRVTFSAVSIDPAEPGHVYAGGTATGGEPFALFETTDSGGAWQRVAGPPQFPGISAIVPDPFLRGRAFVSTHGDGVYALRSGLLEARDPSVSPFVRIGPVYPNPVSASGLVDPRLTIASDRTMPLHVLVTDALGEEVVRIPDVTIPATGQISMVLPLRGHAPGVYFCRVVAPHSVMTTKLIVIR